MDVGDRVVILGTYGWTKAGQKGKIVEIEDKKPFIHKIELEDGKFLYANMEELEKIDDS